MADRVWTLKAPSWKRQADRHSHFLGQSKSARPSSKWIGRCDPLRGPEENWKCYVHRKATTPPDAVFGPSNGLLDSALEQKVSLELCVEM